jgi:hypothetical protein
MLGPQGVLPLSPNKKERIFSKKKNKKGEKKWESRSMICLNPLILGKMI